jgi:hypothetical protein
MNKWQEREKELLGYLIDKDDQYEDESIIMLRMCKSWRDEELKQKKEELKAFINDNINQLKLSYYTDGVSNGVRILNKIDGVFKDE